MLNEGAQQRLVVADCVYGQLGLHHEIIKLKEAKLASRWVWVANS